MIRYLPPRLESLLQPKPACGRASLLFVPEVFLVIHTLIVDESVVFSCDFLSWGKTCTRLWLVDPGHGGLGRGWLWVLFLSDCVASVDPVEVYIHGLSEVWKRGLARR